MRTASIIGWKCDGRRRVLPLGAPRAEGLELPQAHILTPASRDETHYSWASVRYHELDSEETDAFLMKMFGEAFDQEDKPMIEAAYANVKGEDFWEERPVSLGVDNGGLRAPRMIEVLLKAENPEPD